MILKCFTSYRIEKIESGILQEKSLLRLILITTYKQYVIDSFYCSSTPLSSLWGTKKKQEIYSRFGKKNSAWFAPFIVVKWLDTPMWRWQITRSKASKNNPILMIRLIPWLKRYTEQSGFCYLFWDFCTRPQYYSILELIQLAELYDCSCQQDQFSRHI